MRFAALVLSDFGQMLSDFGQRENIGEMGYLARSRARTCDGAAERFIRYMTFTTDRRKQLASRLCYELHDDQEMQRR
jgi:hypothetical protein